jgi:hypothetical protein
MRILSNSTIRATALVAAVTSAVLSSACARVLPWRADPPPPEVNLAFTVERNLLELPTLRIDGRPGRYILGSAAPRTVVDPSFGHDGRILLQLSEKKSVRVDAGVVALGGVAEAIIGADAWNGRAISIDYRSGLVTYQKEGIHSGLMTLFTYDDGPPAIHIEVNGNDVLAIVDTTSPDTLILPARTPSRGTAQVTVAGSAFGAVDVGYANVGTARIGNRLLSRFLITIDYGRRTVGLWRDPRIPLAGS